MELIEITDNNLIKKYIGKLYGELFGTSSIPSDMSFQKVFDELSDNTHFAYEVKCDNEVVAFVTLSESFSIFAHGRYGIINELWVHEDHRSKGIGQAVIQELVEISHVYGWSRIDVTAPPSKSWNRTFEFYQKCGFEFTGRKLKMYPA
ncbi:GNAT family N-acetyltransferase [Vibrio variabilis]|uniref:GNAT family N-acetyltransferase n=1 Tax=Vibrio variabilis TaxID=990271 RepID=UPI000DD84EE7|nr:GNAT family N-acetyltransferase [Vibrio variabilis]